MGLEEFRMAGAGVLSALAFSFWFPIPFLSYKTRAGFWGELGTRNLSFGRQPLPCQVLIYHRYIDLQVLANIISLFRLSYVSVD